MVKSCSKCSFWRGVGDVDDFARFPCLDAILDGGEVGGWVEERAVALLNEERFVLQGGHVAEKDTDGALAVLGQTPGLQVGDDPGQTGVIEAFAKGVVEAHVEPLVNALERRHRKVTQFFPKREVLRVAVVKLDQLSLRSVADGRVGFGGAVVTCDRRAPFRRWDRR